MKNKQQIIFRNESFMEELYWQKGIVVDTLDNNKVKWTALSNM